MGETLESTLADAIRPWWRWWLWPSERREVREAVKQTRRTVMVLRATYGRDWHLHAAPHEGHGSPSGAG